MARFMVEGMLAVPVQILVEADSKEEAENMAAERFEERDWIRRTGLSYFFNVEAERVKR